MRNKIIIGLVVLGVVVGAGYVYFNQRQRPLTPQQESEKNKDAQKSIGGEVVKVDRQKVYFKAAVANTAPNLADKLASEEKIAVVDSHTALVTLTEVGFTEDKTDLKDLKAGTKIIVFYSSLAAENLLADRIQVIK